MKKYPSIPHLTSDIIGKYGYVFPKLDGSNLRFEYNPKKGWVKFGTRERQIDKTDNQFGKAIDLFEAIYMDSWSEWLKKNYRNKSVTIFAEYWGPGSFAGSHIDYMHRLDMIDMYFNDTEEFIHPKEFCRTQYNPINEPIFVGPITQELVDCVRTGMYDNSLELPDDQPFEGVVIKGVENGEIWRCKLKTERYIQELKDIFDSDWKRYY